MAVSLPVGTVTFLFTDIEGSTRLVQELGDRFRPALETHHAILRRAIVAHGGAEVSTEGDAFFAVFRSPIGAVSATVDAQRELAATQWPDQRVIQVRMGLHTGEGELGGDNYLGVDVNRAARIAGAGHGGQVLLSESTRALVAPAIPPDVQLRDLGEHRLKDLPAPEHLYQLVIAGLPAEFSALRTLDSSLTNLVEAETPLIGRERELTDLRGLLAAARLVTVTGPGGIGKTRLAIALGSQAQDQFGDGVVLVELETFTERSVVAVAIGQAVGARPAAERDPEDALIEQVESRQLLLILDNFEQLTGVAPLVARLLAGAARVRIVVTSRVPLHLSGEQEYPLSPLPVPDASVNGGLEALLRIECVQLFVERARRVRPDFQLTDENAGAVAAICRRLDGLPLAIELAAARVKVLAPTIMLDRLEHSLSLLAGGSVDLPARQQTLRGAIDWSYQLLNTDEQALFRRLTAFSGGWTVEAAGDVAAPGLELGGDILDGLITLVDQSLVRPTPEGGSGEPRFEMLQLIREYGAERLAETEEAPLIGRRHAEWFMSLVEEHVAALEGGSDLDWLDRLDREHDNLRAALRWSIEQDEREIGLRIATAVWRFWQRRGHLIEGRHWFERLLPADDQPDSLDAGILAAAHTAAGGIVYWQNKVDEAGVHYQAAYDLDQRFGRSDRLGDDLYNLAFVAMLREDFDTARQRFAKSAELFAAADQPERLADTTAARGALEMRTGDLEQARVWLEEGRRLHLAQGNRARAVDNSMVLSNVYFQLGDASRARELLLGGMEEARVMGDVTRLPLVFDLAAAMAVKEGRPADALRLAAASAQRRATLGSGVPNFVTNVPELVAEARAALAATSDPGAADRAWAEGEALDENALKDLIGQAPS
jgi:predicted ATPase/class 3 adenylate cyclase